VTDAVFDANALASGFAGSRVQASTPGELIRRWRGGSFRLVVSDHILGEVGRTLAKPYFRRRLTDADIADAMTLLHEQARRVTITTGVEGAATHPEDDLVPATAVSAGAPFPVTGDRQLLALGRFRGVDIVSPSAFLAVLDRGDAPAP